MSKTKEAEDSSGVSEENLLLRAIPPEEYGLFSTHLELVPLALRQVIHEPNEPISHVYFPQHGVCSILAFDGTGAAVEIASVGNEGMVGLSVFHGVPTNTQRCFVQIRGEARRLPSPVFADLLLRAPGMRALLHRYAASFFNSVAQFAACNRLHSIDERCARWLLMTHDRVRHSEFLLTQEFLSYMLGARRPAVSIACSRLQSQQLIQYSRGRIRVLDRAGLESAACDCYRVIRAEQDAVVPSATPAS